MSHTSRTVYDVTHVTSSLKDIVFQNKKMRKSPGTSPSVFGGNKIQRLFKPFGNFTQRVWRKQNPYGAITLNLKHFLKKSLLGTSPSVFSGNKIQFMGKNGFCFRKTRSVKFPKIKISKRIRNWPEWITMDFVSVKHARWSSQNGFF